MRTFHDCGGSNYDCRCFNQGHGEFAYISFSGLSEEQLNEIRQIVVSKYFTKGELIFSEKDHGDGFYVVVARMVKVFKVSVEGKEHMMRIVGPGESFRQVSVYTGRTFPASAQAIVKSHLLFLPRTEFAELITNNPLLVLSMLAKLSIRLLTLKKQDLFFFKSLSARQLGPRRRSSM